MTERFSPEYKAFILSDEASVLQEQWKKRGVRKGDWAWDAGTETGRARLVTSTETHTWLLDFLLDGTARRWTAEVDWLPTLTDLLGMIEEVGYRVSIIPEILGSGFFANAFGHETEWPTHETANSRELAAATLAVRVLEGKE